MTELQLLKRKIAKLENQLAELTDVVQAQLVIKEEPAEEPDTDNVFDDVETEVPDADASDLPPDSLPPADPDSTVNAEANTLRLAEQIKSFLFEFDCGLADDRYKLSDNLKFF